MKIIGLDIETTGVDINKGNVLEIGLVAYDTQKIHSLQELFDAPKLTLLIYNNEVVGNLEAFALNKELISEIAQYANKLGSVYIENRKRFCNLLSTKDNHQIWFVSDDIAVFVILRWLIENDLVEYTNYFHKSGLSPDKLLLQIDDYLDGKNVNLDQLKYYIKGITVAGKNVATFDVPYLKNNLPHFNDFIKIKHRMIDPSIVYTVASDNEVPNLYNCMKRLGFSRDTSHRAVDDVLDVLILLYFHFKKSPYRTLISFDSEKNVVDKITSKDEKELIAFKEKHKDKLVFDSLELHKYAVEGRIDSFNKEVKEIKTNERLFVDKSTKVLSKSNKDDIDRVIDAIESNKYRINYHKIFSQPKNKIQVTQHNNEINIYHNFDTYDEKEIISNIKQLKDDDVNDNDN